MPLINWRYYRYICPPEGRRYLVFSGSTAGANPAGQGSTP